MIPRLVLESEKAHHVLVPVWKKGDDLDDALVCLVESTLRHIKSSKEEKDVRIAAANISLDLLEHSQGVGKKSAERERQRERESSTCNTTDPSAAAGDASALNSELEALQLERA